MYLAGDIGGTKTVLAVFNDEFRILKKKIFDKFRDTFLNAFHNKGKLTHLIEKIPVYVIKNE